MGIITEEAGIQVLIKNQMNIKQKIMTWFYTCHEGKHGAWMSIIEKPV